MKGHKMKSQFILLLLVALLFGGCASINKDNYLVGDKLLDVTQKETKNNQEKTISEVENMVADIISILGIKEERKKYFDKISPSKIIYSNQPKYLMLVDNSLVIADTEINISTVTNSIILSSAPINIASGGNNIIISAADINISHDTPLGKSVRKGSLVISKGKVEISFATDSLIYALKGVKISNAMRVQSFNTSEQNISWGKLENILVKPIFKSEFKKTEK